MSGFKLHSYAPFAGFFVIIGEAPVGAESSWHFADAASVERMTPRQFFCDEFDYIGQRVLPGMMTTDILAVRPAGMNTMRPVRADRPSYYLNAWKTGSAGTWYDAPPVETKKVTLQAGAAYAVERKQAVMLAVGAVRVKGPLTEREISAPAIIDCRFGADQFTALSETVLCEVWV